VCFSHGLVSVRTLPASLRTVQKVMFWVSVTSFSPVLSLWLYSFSREESLCASNITHTWVTPSHPFSGMALEGCERWELRRWRYQLPCYPHRWQRCWMLKTTSLLNRSLSDIWCVDRICSFQWVYWQVSSLYVRSSVDVSFPVFITFVNRSTSQSWVRIFCLRTCLWGPSSKSQVIPWRGSSYANRKCSTAAWENLHW
jgi:hypothetical protein